MRCSRCGYIGFRAGAKCDNCNAKLKVAKTSSIFSKKDTSSGDNFSISPYTETGAAAAKIVAEEFSHNNGDKSNGNGNSTNPFINEEGEFDLDLSEVLKKDENLAPIIDPSEYMSSSTSEELSFGDTLPVEAEELDEIDLGEIEVEGLGFDFDTGDIGDDEEIESVDDPADEKKLDHPLKIVKIIDEEPDTQETNSFDEPVETTDLNEYKEMNAPDDEPVMNLGDLLEEATSDESASESKPRSEIPDLNIDLDEDEAVQIREKESGEPKLVIEDLGLELETIENQNTLNNALDSEDSSEINK